MHQSERWMIWLTGALALFGLCSVLAAFLQWNVMSGQLDEMKSGSKDTHDLAEAAIAQANAAKIQSEQAVSEARSMAASVAEMRKESVAMREAADASVAANRAWIVPVPISKTQTQPNRTDIVLHWQNAGKSPAVYVYGTAEYMFQSSPVKTYRFESGCKTLQERITKKLFWNRQTSSVLPDGPFDLPLANMPSEWNQTSNLNRFVSVVAHGCVWYTDVLSNRQRTTEFCYEVQRIPMFQGLWEPVTTIPCWIRRGKGPLLFH